jgi:hypothetical protein
MHPTTMKPYHPREEESTMNVLNRGIIKGLLTAAFATMLGLSAAQAAEDHKAEALKHAEAAVAAGNAAGVAEHAEAAKTHAAAANAEKKSPHYDAAITSLNSAIEHGKMGHADIAKKSAEEAVTHLKAAP